MLCLGLGLPLAKAAVNENILSQHPRHDYLNVGDIDQLENDLRQALGGLESYSFSRSWWKWDRLGSATSMVAAGIKMPSESCGRFFGG